MPATSNVTQAKKMAAQSDGPQAADIINQFVRQYYVQLGKQPDKLYKFYNEDSVFSLCTVDPKGSVGENVSVGKNVVGRENIRQALADLDYGSCKMLLNSPHGQSSVGESVLIVVTGIIILKDHSHRNFTQTFLLAKGKTWYIRNEFLHHFVTEEVVAEEPKVVEEEDTEEPKAAATADAPASEPKPEAEAVSTPVAETAKPEPVAEEAKPAAAAAPVPVPVPVAKVEVEAKVEDAAAAVAPAPEAKVTAAKGKVAAAKSKSAAKSSPAAGAGTSAPAPVPAAGGTTVAAPKANGGYTGRGRGGRGARRGRGGAAETKGRGRGDKGKGWNNRQSNKGGKSQAAAAKPPANTWASRVGATPTAPVVAAAPVEADAADTAVTEIDAATDATNATNANAGAAVVASGGPAVAGHKLAATALFVSGLPQNPQVDEITELFAQYGVVNNVQIHHAQNYCYVQFPTADAVESAMAVQVASQQKGEPGTLLLRDATLMIDRKRPRTSHNRGRGRNNRGGRGRRRGNDRKAGGDSRGRGRGVGGDRNKRGRGNAY